MLRAALVVAVALLVALCGAGTGQAASGTVQKLDGSSASRSLSELGHDVKDRDYTIRDGSAPDRTERITGTSLSALLQDVDADTFGVGSIEVSGGGARVTLAPDHLA